jgi:hypothetical protein
MYFVVDMYFTRCHFDIYTLTWYIDERNLHILSLMVWNHGLKSLKYFFPTKSLSVYPTKESLLVLEYNIPYPIVPAIYLRILFPTCQCESFGDSMNLEIKLIAYIMFGLVAVRYMRFPTNLLNRVGSTMDPLSSLLSFVLVQLELVLVYSSSFFKHIHGILCLKQKILNLDWMNSIPKYLINPKSSHFKFLFHG